MRYTLAQVGSKSMSSLLYIFIGFSVIYITFLLVSWGLTAFYFLVSKEKVNWFRDLKISSTLAVVGAVSSLLLMMAFSSTSIYVYSFLSFLFSGYLYMVFLKVVWKFSYFDASIISFTLSIILNFGWLRLLGMV